MAAIIPRKIYNVPHCVQEAMCHGSRDGKHNWDPEPDEPGWTDKCGACGRRATEIIDELIWMATI